MEMVGEYKELQSVLIDGAPRFGTSTAAFDNELELLWVGNLGGHITSYCGGNLQKFTSFQIDPTCPVVGIETVKERVFSLTKDRLTCHTKNGLKEYEFVPESGFEMQAMVKCKEPQLLIGGKGPALIQLDMNTGVSSRRDFSEDGKMENGVSLFRCTQRRLFCGDVVGNVTLRDPDTLKVIHMFNAHSGTLADFDVHGHLLVTCGYSLRHGMERGQPQSLNMERLIKVFDMRMMRSVTPIQSPIQASFVRFIPTYTRRLIIISESGQFILIEDNAAITSSTPVYQLNNMCGNVSGFAMSPSMQALSFGDSGGFLQLWSSTASPNFHQYPKMPEFATIPDPLDPIPIDDLSIPLSLIPMPRCREKLLSDWPRNKCIHVSRRPPPIDPAIIQTMKIVHGIGYAPNPGNRRRNQVPYKLKDIAYQDKIGKKAAVPDSPLGREEQPHLYMVPKKYRKITLKYSKLGYEEDEMVQHYNKTNFAGLDPNIMNAYCNSMLQVLYFLQPLRCALLQHHNLEKEFDLAEELGFFFRMQDSSKGGVLQASNFLRAFRTIPEATALGLVQSASHPEQVGTQTHGNLSQLIQNWNCFILQQLQTELSQASEEQPNLIPPGSVNKPPERTTVEKIFGTEMQIVTQFRNGNRSERSNVQLMFTLNYPAPPQPGETPEMIPFSDIITRSIRSRVQTKSWDLQSETYQPMVQQRSPISLPDVLALNCGLNRDEDCQFWKTQTELVQQAEAAKAAESAEQAKNEPQRPAGDTEEPEMNRSNSSDAWNIFVEREGLDLSFDQQNKVTWVPLSIKMKLNDGELEVMTNDNKSPVHNGNKTQSDDTEVIYDLHASVCHIIDPRTGGNLVAHVYVKEKYHQVEALMADLVVHESFESEKAQVMGREVQNSSIAKVKEGVTHTQWYLFNDFQICSIDGIEAVDFDLQWKVPAVLYYARRDISKRYDFNVQFPLTASILSPSESLSKGHPQSPAPITFTPLLPQELPVKSEMLVALDAEFVTLNNEEAELHSDGTRSTIKPSHLSVARVTVVRGEGELEGLPIIDDYISTQEQVVDYLTKFSGIQPGDLDASISSKHLSTLKLTYCKLSYLIHCGCIIIGHGLRKDFKVINIVVPSTQVRDTVMLFHLPRKRFISLRFLAWFFLKLKIQEKNHDSIEDACTALKLYKKYLELTENETQVSKFHQTVLKQMYEEGRKLEWKVPGSDM